MKAFSLFLIAAGLAVVGLITTNFTSTTRANNFTVIDGANNAELIPDRVAYSLLFRLLSSPRNDFERSHINSYVADIGFENDADSAVLLSAAVNHKRRVDALDMHVNGIKEKERNHNAPRPPETQLVLRKLQPQYDLVTDETVASLSSALSASGQATLQRFMDERFKKKVKLQPAPAPKF